MLLKLSRSLTFEEKIRNFGIVAHVDHGKSTLADRLLELTGVVDRSNHANQMLDKLQVFCVARSFCFPSNILLQYFC